MDDLVARARRGDRAAVEELLAGIAPSVYRFGRRLCGNAHDADDVLQDTLINVADHIGEFDGRASLASWVFALARNACARRRRGLKNRPPEAFDRVADEPDIAPSPELGAAGRELAAALGRALATLPLESREVVLLRDVEGLSASETASALGTSVDAVKSRLHRAREALREELRPLLEAPAPGGSDCPDVTLLWSKKLEGELSQEDCAAMEKHVESCTRCARACGALKQALGACRSAGSGAVPASVQERVKAAVRAWPA
jgi:RNA polymerase sigma-70 factor (ECF subfamily)